MCLILVFFSYAYNVYVYFLISLECLLYLFNQFLLTKAMIFEKGLRCFFLQNKETNYIYTKKNKIKKKCNVRLGYISIKLGATNKICRKGFNKLNNL